MSRYTEVPLDEKVNHPINWENSHPLWLALTKDIRKMPLGVHHDATRKTFLEEYIMKLQVGQMRLDRLIKQTSTRTSVELRDNIRELQSYKGRAEILEEREKESCRYKAMLNTTVQELESLKVERKTWEE